MSLRDPLGHLGLIWNNSEPSKVSCNYISTAGSNEVILISLTYLVVRQLSSQRSLLKSLIWVDSYLRVSSKQMERTPCVKQPWTLQGFSSLVILPIFSKIFTKINIANPRFFFQQTGRFNWKTWLHCSCIWHWNHKVAFEVSRRKRGSNYDDFLYDWWTRLPHHKSRNYKCRYSSYKIRKTQNEHLNIICQNLNCLYSAISI